jgi:peptide chain release factor 3
MAETQANQSALSETISREVATRRTFAIISHPDAGKTTLTEKLLLYGGAIHEAGSIKQRKAARHAASDWMAIEQERGISVTSSVLRFEKDGIKYNLLDTPGHKDFSEDTLRTLIAADCALMVIDVAKGVEEQTEKLFEVCKMRNIPVITFVNKCDRPGMEPLEVMSNIESKLGIRAVPASWPARIRERFSGCIRSDRLGNASVRESLTRRQKSRYRSGRPCTKVLGITSISESDKEAFCEIIELISDDFHTMNATEFRNGKVTPVFFGSA